MNLIYHGNVFGAGNKIFPSAGQLDSKLLISQHSVNNISLNSNTAMTFESLMRVGYYMKTLSSLQQEFQICWCRSRKFNMGHSLLTSENVTTEHSAGIVFSN